MYEIFYAKSLSNALFIVNSARQELLWRAIVPDGPISTVDSTPSC
jgi:hypothetical protein